ncbi:MAG: hypothetical protein F2667_11550 [Actinobacteria bacterium]|nr:hypothetical protein [Actinomycetota bacterium]
MSSPASAAPSILHGRLAPRRGSARAASWWGKAWVRAVEESAYGEAELATARSLARAGRVGGISIGAGEVVAAVEDASGMWSVSVAVPVLDPAAQDGFVESVAAEAGRIAALLAGELPHALVEHAEEAGVELLPFGGELSGSCSCDAWMDPCAHALGVLYQVGWLVDADPFVLLHLRGLPRDALLARLHDLDTAAGSAPVAMTGLDADRDLSTAYDAASRAARLLELLERGEDPPDHLF